MLMPVTRIQPMADCLAIPREVMPTTDSPLEHVLFALKHEGTDLQILSETMAKLEPASLLAELKRQPTGGYIRTVCYLWEQFTGQRLSDLPPIGGPTVQLFDPKDYITGPSQRNAKWKVAFNGLGSLTYCACVSRTARIEAAIRSDVLGRAQEFLGTLGQGLLDQALAWAYLQETQESFAIEREAPSEAQARAFVALLHQAHDGRPLSEGYLAELHNSVLAHPFRRGYRTEQNWLRGPARGSAGITYMPPPPHIVPELMADLMSFANIAPTQIHPLIAASVASFGFAFIHPFGDGNGRLSRFIFHHALCRSGRLARGLLLPVSVAMKRNEDQYLRTLQDYSQQTRELWSVKWIDQDLYDMRFHGSPAIYRYWDATRCVEFGVSMAEQALEVDLRQETEFLVRYDRIVKKVDAKFDVRGSHLSTLVICCLDNGGKLSKHRRKQFALSVPEAVFDYIEQVAAETGLVGHGAEQTP